MALTDNLLLHYGLNDGSGTSATDSSGNARTGTLVNTPTWTTAKVGASALTFASASSQYVTMPVSNLLRNINAVTVAFWVKTTATTNQRMFFVSSNTGTTTSRFSISHSAVTAGVLQVVARAGDGEGAQTKNATGNAINDGNWHYVSVVVDIANDTITIYVDGSSVSATGTISFTATSISDTDPQAARLGSLGDSTLFFNGSLDEVSLWSRALSGAEITTLYNAGSGLAYPWAVGQATAKRFGGMRYAASNYQRSNRVRGW